MSVVTKMKEGIKAKDDDSRSGGKGAHSVVGVRRRRRGNPGSFGSSQACSCFVGRHISSEAS